MISLTLLAIVAFVCGQEFGYQNELDLHGSPFVSDQRYTWISPYASPPYSWEEVDMTGDRAKGVIYFAQYSINERLRKKGIGPVQIVASNAIWTRKSKTNTVAKEDAISYISYNYVAFPLSDTIFECMSPMEVYTKWEGNKSETGMVRSFDTTCRPVTMRNCYSDLVTNKLVINKSTVEAVEASRAIRDFIDKTLNPQRFEELSYKVDVLMGVSCAYKQRNKICLDLYEQRISDVDVELRPCFVCMERNVNGTWEFETPTCHPGSPYMIN